MESPGNSPPTPVPDPWGSFSFTSTTRRPTVTEVPVLSREWVLDPSTPPQVLREWSKTVVHVGPGLSYVRAVDDWNLKHVRTLS